MAQSASAPPSADRPSVFASRRSKGRGIGCDASAAVNYTADIHDERARQFSQELQLLYDSGPLNVLLGKAPRMHRAVTREAELGAHFTDLAGIGLTEDGQFAGERVLVRSKGGEVEFIDEEIDDTDKVIFADPVLQTLREKRRL